MLPAGSVGRQCSPLSSRYNRRSQEGSIDIARAGEALTALWGRRTVNQLNLGTQGVGCARRLAAEPRGLHPGDRSALDIWESGMGFKFRSLCQKQSQNSNSTSNQKKKKKTTLGEYLYLPSV